MYPDDDPPTIHDKPMMTKPTSLSAGRLASPSFTSLRQAYARYGVLAALIVLCIALSLATPAALAAAKQALASLYAERLSSLDAVLESATAVRDAIRAGEPLPVAEDSAPSVSERVDWDEEDDDESDGKRRKKKRKKKR